MSEPASREPEESLEKRRARERARQLLFGAARSVKVGRFELGRRVGAGAMGVVYEARDPQLERSVAIKVIEDELGTTPERRRRMLEEAKAMARLSHPNVVIVHDVGEEDGRIFIAMELVEGEDLAHWLEAAPRSTESIAQVLLGAGRGLIAAHERGLVHRDIKPENVLIDREGRARLADFGVVQSVAEPSGDGPGSGAERREREVAMPEAGRMTATGALVGTPAYMSPEQLHGQPADTLSDQFAFCVTFYEALWGVRPFEATTVGDLARAMALGALHEPAVDRDVPDALRAALERGLSVEPQARFPSMKDLLEALATAIDGEGEGRGGGEVKHIAEAAADDDAEGEPEGVPERADRLPAPAPPPPLIADRGVLAVMVVAALGGLIASSSLRSRPEALRLASTFPRPRVTLPEPGPRYPLEGLALLDEDCPDGRVLLAATPASVDDRWSWTRQALLAHPSFEVRSGVAVPEEGTVAFSEVKVSPSDDSALALVAACQPQTCNRLAAMYRVVVRTSRPRLSCGPFTELGGAPVPVALLSGVLERDLPTEGDVRAQCARLAACRIAADPTIEGDPGIACQKAPHRFRTLCAREPTCDEVLACLKAESRPAPR